MNALIETALSNSFVALVLAMAVAIIARRRCHPRVIHLLWLMVLIKFLTPPIWTVPVFGTGTIAADPVEEIVIAGERPIYFPVARRAALPAPVVIPAWSWQEILLAIWGIGMLVIMAATLFRILRFYSVLKNAHPANAEILDIARRLSHRLGLRRPPEVLILPLRITPAVWFLCRRPRILLPCQLAESMSREQLETILLHELAHIRRGDHWVRLLELAVTTVFWWNPVVWWTRKNLREMEEHCCDGLVLETLPGSARSYAIALIETVEFLSHHPGRLPIGATAARPTVTLTRRIEMLKHGNLSHRLPARKLILLIACGLLPLSLAFAEDKKPEVTEIRTKAYHVAGLSSTTLVRDVHRRIEGEIYDVKLAKNGRLLITASEDVHHKVQLYLELLTVEKRRAALKKQLGIEPGEKAIRFGEGRAREVREFGIEKDMGRGMMDADGKSGIGMPGQLEIENGGRLNLDRYVLSLENLNNQSCLRCHDRSAWLENPVLLHGNKLLLQGSWHCPGQSAVLDNRKKTGALWLDFDAKPTDDATFLKRIHLDLLGTLPSRKELREFVKDKSQDKRRKKVEELLKRLPPQEKRKSSSSAVPKGGFGGMSADGKFGGVFLPALATDRKNDDRIFNFSTEVMR